METRTVTCIKCPRGCAVTVGLEDGQVVSVSGNSCLRGDRYARDEIFHPVRTVTSTVPVLGSAAAEVVSVKTSRDVPKDMVMEVMRSLVGVRATAPVSIGDVIVHDVAGTGSDIIATREA